MLLSFSSTFDDDTSVSSCVCDPTTIVSVSLLLQEGEVLLDEEELPSQFMRSDEPNCQMAEIEVDSEERIVLVALCDVKTGDELTIAPDEEEDEEEGMEEGDKCNTGTLTVPSLMMCDLCVLYR